jgi:2',3'-cyclic-nucleotide 2'-phosphodiesterase (5'-nucleotidase family)
MRLRNFSFLPLLLLLAMGCSGPRVLQVASRDGRWYQVDSTTGNAVRLTDMLAPYKKGVDTQMKVVIAHTDGPLTKAQPESTLGNLVADAQLMAGRQLDPKVDAAVSNYGGLRLPFISPGTITRGTIYELMPFDNTVCIVEMPGEVLQTYCNSMARRKGWPVSGLQFTIEDTSAKDIRINGETIDPNRVYKLALNDYNARGGDNCDFLVPLRKRFTTYFIRDAIMQYLASYEAKGQAYHPTLDQRVRHAAD